MSFDVSFQNLLGWEGGFGNAAHDDGGPTNLGVVQAEYDTSRSKAGKPHQSVRFITQAEAKDIYRNEYWTPTRCDDLDPGLANAVFDGDVNSGDHRGVEWLQEAINQVSGKKTVAVDGKSGPATVAAAKSLPVDKLIDAHLSIRLAFMKVCRNNEGELLWPHFGGGWSDRIVGVRKQSHALAGLPEASTPLAPPPSIPAPVPTSNPAPTPTMEPVMANATPTTSTVSPASAFGILLSPLLNIITNVFNSAGSVLIGAGGSTLLATLLNVQTGPFASIAAGSTIVGAIMTGAAYYASHTLVKGTNAATVAAATPAATSAAS